MSNETNLSKEEFVKINLQFRAEMFKENIKQAMKTALFSLNAAFLLNGTGATAMFAKSMNIPAILCTFGSIVAVFCMGISYLVLLAIADSWVNFHSKCKILGGVAEFFSKAFLCRFPPENFPRPVVYPVHSLPV